MKSSLLSAAGLSFALVSAHPHLSDRQDTTNTSAAVGDWVAPSADAFRGPCPMMNTLANHGFLPREGGNITLENAVFALHTGLNFNTSIATIMWQQAIIANPDPNTTFFTLDHLNRHNVLEHDGSISRSDAYFGNNHVFNQTVFDTSTRYWEGVDTLNASHFANAKVFRQLESKAFNPTYMFTAATTEAFSLGEMAAPILIFGDIEAGTVDKSLVTYFFENEKLPTELGWSKQADEITLEKIMMTSARVRAATSLFTDVNANETDSTHSKKRRDLHAGLW